MAVMNTGEDVNQGGGDNRSMVQIRKRGIVDTWLLVSETQRKVVCKSSGSE